MYEGDILLWAAGSPRPLPQIDHFSFPLVMDGIQYHRLTHRFAARAEQQKPDWWTPLVRLTVNAMKEGTNKRFQVQSDALHAIASAFAEMSEFPIIGIKGNTTYALTGEEQDIRSTTDLDLFTRDPQMLIQTLKRAGFIESPPKGAHEIAQMTRDDICIDLHDYFPVPVPNFSLDNPEILDPALHPGHWVQNVNIEDYQIRYDDLLKDAVQSEAPVTRGLRFPGVNMSLLILCAHTFQDYGYKWLDWSKLRLVSLAEVYDLMGHAQFNYHYFLALAQQFGGEQAIQYISYCLRAFFADTTSLPTATAHKYNTPQQHFRFPQRLWRLFWAVLDVPMDVFLVNQGKIPLKLTLEQLGANTVVATGPGTQQRLYTTHNAWSGDYLERVIFLYQRSLAMPIQYAVSYDDANITFKISPGYKAPDIADHMRLTFDKGYIAIVYDKYKNELTTAGFKCNVAVEHSEDGYTVNVSLPLASIGVSPLLSTPMWFGIIQINRTGEMVSGALIPMNIVLPSPLQ